MQHYLSFNVDVTLHESEILHKKATERVKLKDHKRGLVWRLLWIAWQDQVKQLFITFLYTTLHSALTSLIKPKLKKAQENGHMLKVTSDIFQLVNKSLTIPPPVYIQTVHFFCLLIHNQQKLIQLFRLLPLADPSWWHKAMVAHNIIAILF